MADLSSTSSAAGAGSGVGRVLLGRLIDEARGLGFHKMVLAAFPNNAAGMRLYAADGLHHGRVVPRAGLLDGRWVDVIVMEQILG